MPPPNSWESLFAPGFEWSGRVTADPSLEGLAAALDAARKVADNAEAGFAWLGNEIDEQGERIKVIRAAIDKADTALGAARVRYNQTVARTKERKEVNTEIKQIADELRTKRGELAELEFNLETNRAERKTIEDAYPTLRQRVDSLEEFNRTPIISPQADSNVRLSLSPTGPNVHETMPRYMRVLVWNLENFTRDARPRGSAPIDSARNQARLAAVAHLAAKLGADAVLMMETGADVGTATTHLGKKLQALQADNAPLDTRQWHPLVSPASHAIPKVELDYDRVSLGRPTADRVLALRALLTAFRIRPCDLHTPVTDKQMEDACVILLRASPASRASDALPLRFDTVAGKQVLEQEMTFSLANGNRCPAASWIHSLWDELCVVRGGGENVREPWWSLQHMAEALETGQNTGVFVDVELLDLACEIVLECREVIEDGSRLAYLPAGLAEGVELALLFILKAHGYVNGEARALWKSGQDGEPSLPLLTAYCTTAQPVRLRAHDREVGPVASAYDPGLILNAMRRAGILEYKFETYGVLFRAPNEKALFDAIALPESEAVVGAFSGGGAYGIVQSDREGHALPVQEAGDVLGGRSALYIALPVSAHLRIPLLVLHNRFTGTAEIKAMDDPAYGLGLSQGDKVIRARILTLLEVAKVAKGGSEPKAMIAASIRRPLIVGDFNFPREIIDEPSSASNNVAARRYAYLRRELRFGMEMHGYFRRTSAPPQTATSLVSYASIASLNTVYSQPYDAVYQPFDFLGGAAQVRSGVIQGIRTMFETSLLTEPLTVAPVVQQDAPDVVMNEEDPDEDEKAEVADPDAMDDAPVADNAPQQATTFNTVLADEICRIYRSLGRAAVQDIANSAEWARKSTTLRRKGPHVQWQLDHARLTAMIAARAQHLREQILATPFEPVAISQAPLGEWLAAAAAAVAACPGRAPKATLNLRATLKTLFDRLVNLETNVDARLWVGYRALVSDHLPVIVEIDLQPY